MKKILKLTALFTAVAMCITGCGDSLGESKDVYTREESLKGSAGHI